MAGEVKQSLKYDMPGEIRAHKERPRVKLWRKPWPRVSLLIFHIILCGQVLKYSRPTDQLVPDMCKNVTHSTQRDVGDLDQF